MDADIKTDLRKRAFAARKAAHAAGQGDATAHLLAEILRQPPGIIAAYMPIRTEIDPLPAMQVLAARGYRLCVPVIRAAAQPLDFCEWTPQGSMTEGAFGASVPEAGAWLIPDTIVVPLVAFDGHGNRLGYGGGFYDRTLQGLRAVKSVRAIGFAYAEQQLALHPERTDEPLDTIVTQHGSLAPVATSG